MISLGPGVIGSATDIATLVVVVVGVYRLGDRVEDLSAGIVALARGRPPVDDEQLQSDFDIEDRHVRDYLEVRADGSDSDD